MAATGFVAPRSASVGTCACAHRGGRISGSAGANSKVWLSVSGNSTEADSTCGCMPSHRTRHASVGRYGVGSLDVIPFFSYASAFAWGDFDSDCQPRTYASSKGTCETTGGRLAASLHTPSSVSQAASQLCLSSNEAWFWLGGEWSMVQNAFIWQNGSGIKVSQGWLANQPAAKDDSAAVAFSRNSVGFSSILRDLADFVGIYVMVQLCEYKICSANDCSALGTLSVREGRYELGSCCTCRVAYGGNDCSVALCTCNPEGTQRMIPDVPSSECCECRPHFAGQRCEVRICSIEHDCRGNAVSISGQFPNCLCQCIRGFGGAKLSDVHHHAHGDDGEDIFSVTIGVPRGQQKRVSLTINHRLHLTLSSLTLRYRKQNIDSYSVVISNAHILRYGLDHPYRIIYRRRKQHRLSFEESVTVAVELSKPFSAHH